jgi:small subunit ribosomal protein S3
MGQKTNPIGFRLGVIKSWESRWFSEKDYSKLLQEDITIRKFLIKKLSSAGISKVVIERPAKLAKITIHTSRPGVIIGKKGSDIEKLKKDIGNITEGEVSINILEIKKPELDSQLVAMKRAVQSAMRLGALGIRVNCSGRLGGAEIARTEWYREGRVPLHTLRADIDYGVSRANTTYGICGVKVWIFKGEKFDKDVNDIQKDKPSNDILKKAEE